MLRKLTFEQPSLRHPPKERSEVIAGTMAE